MTFLPGSQFEKYFESIANITKVFEGAIPAKVHGPATQQYEGHKAIVVSNPYFSRRKVTSTMESIPLGGIVDPTGFLTRSQPQNFHHTMDNQVVYLREYVENEKVK